MKNYHIHPAIVIPVLLIILTMIVLVLIGTSQISKDDYYWACYHHQENISDGNVEGVALMEKFYADGKLTEFEVWKLNQQRQDWKAKKARSDIEKTLKRTK